MKHKITCALMTIVFSTQAQNAFLQSWLDSKVFRNASVGVVVYDLDQDKELLSSAANKNLVSASTLKLISTAAAIKELGANYQFKTELAYCDSLLVNGELKGNLYINGFGDPTLGSKYFFDDQRAFLQQWVQAAAKAGIKSIEGDVIAIDSYFGASPAPYNWLWSDISNYYGAPARALNVFDNQFTLTFNSKEAGSSAEISNVHPLIPYLKITNKVLASEEQKDLAYVLGGPLEFNKIVEGSIPAHKSAFKVKGAIPDPALYLACVFLEELKKNGIVVQGTYKSTRDKIFLPLQVFHQHLSPRLQQIISITNKQSNNLFAEACGAAVQLKLQKTDFQKTVEATFPLCAFEESLVEDACGLSPMNAFSPKSFALLLKTMYHDSNNFLPFKESLSLAGNDGTLKYFGINRKFKGHFAGKSGSMTGVKSYAGYLKSASGKNIAVVIMVNHFSAESSVVKEKSEDLLEHIFNSY